MRLVVGAATDVGRVRTGNEDSYLVDERMGLVALADGMGGHNAGEVASATALEAVRASVTSGHAIREAIEEANRAVYEKSLTDESLVGMGTTLTAGTLVSGRTILIGHVGDSRAYLLRDGGLSRVTTDHSHVEDLVQEGTITKDEAAVHPMRSVITRAVGIESAVDVDIFSVRMEPDDVLLICSDGLTDMVREDDIAAALRREPEPERAAGRLVDSANAAGGEDNITVLVVTVSDELPPAATAPTEAPERAALAPDEATPAAAAAERAPKAPRHWGRVALWVIPVVLVLVLAVGAVGWYARKDYFVALRNGRVTVYKGVPGGVLGWDPTVQRRTAVTADDLRPAGLASVRREPKFGSLADANAYVERLRSHNSGI